MSVDIVCAFSYLLEKERDIFKPSEAKLADFSASLPDDVEEMALAIINWCKEQGIYDNLRNALTESTKVGNKPNNLTAKQCQDLIKNATRTEETDNSTASNSKPTQ
jgi:hypothetical protein